MANTGSWRVRVGRPFVSSTIKKFLHTIANEPGLDQGTICAAKAKFAASFKERDECKGAQQEDVGGPSCHVVTPDAGVGAERGRFIFIHGGGWMLGDWPSHCRMLVDIVNASKWTGLHVDYTLTPDATFDTAIQEVLRVCRQEYNTFHKPLCLVGNSVGGNIAIAVAEKLASEGIPVAKQVLMWPVTDNTASCMSWKTFSKGFFLSAEVQKWLLKAYVPKKAQRRLPHVSPLLASDQFLEKMPPTFIAVAGNDILRDEGVKFARRLDAVGVDVSLVMYPNTIHDWALLDPLADTADTTALCRQVGAEIAAAHDARSEYLEDERPDALRVRWCVRARADRTSHGP